jgi:hypothetical protein
MYSLIVENKYKQQMELTHNEAYVIESIEGLDPPEAVINTTRNANADGSVYNSSYAKERQIIITLAINAPVEENRIQLYRYFKSKYPVKLYYKNSLRNVFIEGYCKKPLIEFFTKKEIAQITILCPNPFFSGAVNEITDFSTVNPLFEFPFSIEEPPGEIEFAEIILDQEKNIRNNGDVETGAVFILKSRGSVVDPVIYNVESNVYFRLNITMQLGDEIYINTKTKQKTVTLTRDGVTTNIIGNLDGGSTWLVFDPGDNIFMATAEESAENLDCYCILTDQFEGV